MRGMKKNSKALLSLLEESRDFETALLADTTGQLDPTPAHEYYMGGSIRSVTPSLGPMVGVAFTCELDTRTPDEGLDVEEHKKRLVGYSRHVDAMRKVNEPSPGTGRPIPWHQDSPYWNTSKLAGSVW